jgi:hypothetical protein
MYGLYGMSKGFENKKILKIQYNTLLFKNFLAVSGLIQIQKLLNDKKARFL